MLVFETLKLFYDTANPTIHHIRSFKEIWMDLLDLLIYLPWASVVAAYVAYWITGPYMGCKLNCYKLRKLLLLPFELVDRTQLVPSAGNLLQWWVHWKWQWTNSGSILATVLMRLVLLLLRVLLTCIHLSLDLVDHFFIFDLGWRSNCFERHSLENETKFLTKGSIFRHIFLLGACCCETTFFWGACYKVLKLEERIRRSRLLRGIFSKTIQETRWPLRSAANGVQLRQNWALTKGLPTVRFRILDLKSHRDHIFPPDFSHLNIWLQKLSSSFELRFEPEIVEKKPGTRSLREAARTNWSNDMSRAYFCTDAAKR